MTAVGLLCRQYMENWGPSHPRMIKAIQSHIKTNPPDRQDVYYYYYATQVMHHFGGEEWKAWNEKMRDYLIKKQDGNNNSAHFGSWSPEGDQWGRAGRDRGGVGARGGWGRDDHGALAARRCVRRFGR